MAEARFPKVLYKLPEPGTEAYQVIAGVCRAMSRHNVNPMVIANFSQMAQGPLASKDTWKLIHFIEQWVTVSEKEKYGQDPNETQAQSQITEPDVQTPTGTERPTL